MTAGRGGQRRAEKENPGVLGRGREGGGESRPGSAPGGDAFKHAGRPFDGLVADGGVEGLICQLKAGLRYRHRGGHRRTVRVGAGGGADGRERGGQGVDGGAGGEDFGVGHVASANTRRKSTAGGGTAQDRMTPALGPVPSRAFQHKAIHYRNIKIQNNHIQSVLEQLLRVTGIQPIPGR